MKSIRFEPKGLRAVAWEPWSTVTGVDRRMDTLGGLSSRLTDDVSALLAGGTALHAGSLPSKGYGHYDLLAEP